MLLEPTSLSNHVADCIRMNGKFGIILFVYMQLPDLGKCHHSSTSGSCNILATDNSFMNTHFFLVNRGKQEALELSPSVMIPEVGTWFWRGKTMYHPSESGY